MALPPAPLSHSHARSMLLHFVPTYCRSRTPTPAACFCTSYLPTDSTHLLRRGHCAQDNGLLRSLLCRARHASRLDSGPVPLPVLCKGLGMATSNRLRSLRRHLATASGAQSEAARMLREGLCGPRSGGRWLERGALPHRLGESPTNGALPCQAPPGPRHAHPLIGRNQSQLAQPDWLTEPISITY